jgi:hypothetical protein
MILALRIALGVACLLAIPRSSLGQLTVYDAGADAQVAVNQACATGGVVRFPASYTLTSTLTVACNTNTKFAVVLQGSPTALTCNTGAAPCIRFGGMPLVQLAVTGHGIRDFRIYGPGRTVSSSVGIKIIGRAFGGSVRDVEIRNFDVGLSYDGDPSTGYVFDWVFDNLRIGAEDNVQGITPNVNLAVQIYGEVTGVFHHANLAGQQRSIRMHGPAGTGANVEFIDARLNQASKTAGQGAVWVQSGGGILAMKSGDIEGSYPLFLLNSGTLVIHDTTFVGDPNNSGNQPAIAVPGSGPWFLDVDNARLAGANGASPGPVVRIYDPSNFGNARITGSTLFGGGVHGIELLSAGGETVIAGNSLQAGAVVIQNSKNVSITGNGFLNAINNAVRIEGNSKNIVIDGNRIHRWNGSGAGFPAIEVVDGGSQNRISIRNNLFADPLLGAPSAVHCGNGNPRPDIQVAMNSTGGMAVTGSCIKIKNK